jgi:hypothetical protein
LRFSKSLVAICVSHCFDYGPRTTDYGPLTSFICVSTWEGASL